MSSKFYFIKLFNIIINIFNIFYSLLNFKKSFFKFNLIFKIDFAKEFNIIIHKWFKMQL